MTGSSRLEADERRRSPHHAIALGYICCSSGFASHGRTGHCRSVRQVDTYSPSAPFFVTKFYTMLFTSRNNGFIKQPLGEGNV
jgi:hypothetical protein